MKWFFKSYLLVASVVVFAQNTTLDNTFGTNGVATNCFVNNYIINSTVQNNSNLIFVKPIASISNPQLIVSQLNTDGSLDTNFGTNGYANFNLEPVVNSTIVQSDDKILLAGFIQLGSENGFNNNIWLARLLPNGAFDNSFANNGILNLELDTLYDEAYAVMMQPDGKILVGGTTGGVAGGFCVVRLLSNGSLDTSFGTNGKVITIFTPNNQSIIKALALQPDGKIVAVGTRMNGSTQNIALARYTTNGILDTSFGTNGKVETPVIPGEHDELKTIKLQPDGKILVLADHNPYSSNFSVKGAILLRYTTNGLLDTAFGNNGWISEIGTIMANDLMILENSKIFVTGIDNNFNNLGVARYLNNGSVDNSFGTNGKMVFNLSDYSSAGLFLYSHPNNKIVVCGIENYNYCVKCIRLNQETLHLNAYNVVNNLTIYPNPSKGMFTISATIDAGIVETSLYDVTGKLILNNSYNHSGGEFTKEITTNLPAGFYMVNLKTQTGTVAKKLIIE